MTDAPYTDLNSKRSKRRRAAHKRAKNQQSAAPSRASRRRSKRASRANTPAITHQPSFQLSNKPGKLEQHNGFYEKVCGLVDPFCDAARGSRYPDGGHAATLPFTNRFTQSLTTAANGQVGAAVAIGPSQLVYGLDATATGGTFTMPTTLTNTGGTTAYNNAATIRINSVGVRYVNTQNSTAAQGVVTFMTVPNMPSAGTLVIGNFTSTTTDVMPNSAGCEYTYVIFPSDARLARTLQASSTATFQLSSAAGWPTLVVAVTGATASVNIGFLDVIINYEFTIENTSVLTFLLPEPAKEDSAVVQAVGAVYDEAKSFVKGGVQAVGNEIKAGVRKALVEMKTDFAESFGRLRIMP